jgi:hypothetical protein
MPFLGFESRMVSQRALSHAGKGSGDGVETCRILRPPRPALGDWIAQILGSDVIRTRLAERASELIDPVLRASVEQHFNEVVFRTLAILREARPARAAAEIPDNLVIRALEVSTRALGSKEQTPVQVNVVNHLEVLGENLVKLLQRKKAAAGHRVAAQCASSSQGKFMSSDTNGTVTL